MTRALIDTHTLINSIIRRDKITRAVWHILNDYGNQIYVSSATVEETIHLQQGGSIRVPQWKTAADIIGFINSETYFGIKYVGEGHLKRLADLQYFKDHKDPFDRMIIAHALEERLTLISADTQFPRYTKYGLDLFSYES